MWVDALYNHNTPEEPIQYVLRSRRQLVFDYRSLNTYKFGLQRHELHDVDGRIRNFWSLELEYYFELHEGTKTEMVTMNFTLKPGYIKYNQFYDYKLPTATQEHEASSSVNAETNDGTFENGLLFNIFYVLSQLGGLYSFLVALLGFILYPIISQLFLKDIINDFNDKEIQLLRNEEDFKRKLNFRVKQKNLRFGI